MHQARPGVQISIVCGDRSRQIAGGQPIDLDDVLIPARDGQPAHTLRDALGAHVETAFEVVVEDAASESDSRHPFIADAPAREE